METLWICFEINVVSQMEIQLRRYQRENRNVFFFCSLFYLVPFHAMPCQLPLHSNPFRSDCKFPQLFCTCKNFGISVDILLITYITFKFPQIFKQIHSNKSFKLQDVKLDLKTVDSSPFLCLNRRLLIQLNHWFASEWLKRQHHHQQRWCSCFNLNFPPNDVNNIYI